MRGPINSTEESAHFGGGYTGIYRGAKACLYEGGIRISLAITWPGRIPMRKTPDRMAVNADRLPTLAQLCGISLEQYDLDGRNLVPLIKDPLLKSPHAGYCWEFRNQWVVRDGNWKLLGNPVNKSGKAPLTAEDRLSLVNLEQNPGELNNLAAEHPERVAPLQSRYEARRKRPKNRTRNKRHHETQ